MKPRPPRTVFSARQEQRITELIDRHNASGGTLVERVMTQPRRGTASVEHWLVDLLEQAIEKNEKC